MLLLISSGCSTGRPEGSAIIVATANSPADLDPRVALDEASQKADQLLFNSLVNVDANLQVTPELAETLEHPDERTYVARLRHGVLFHNGRELTAEDVAYTFRSFLDPRFRGRSGAYRIVQSVEVIDPYTVAFHLKEPLGFVSNQPRDGNRAGGIGRAKFPLADRDRALQAGFLQTGRPNRAHTIRSVFGGAPRNDGVVLKVVPDDTMRGLELRKGTVDLIINDVSPDIVWQLQQERTLGVETAPGTDYAYIGLNLRDPVLQHLEVRQAFGYAIDRDAIVKYLRRGFASTAVGIVPPMSWAFERERVRLSTRSGGGRTAARRGGISRSGRAWPASPTAG